MNPKAMIDMDGVLANLFDFIGQRIYGKDYKDVTAEEKHKARSIWTNKEEFYQQLGGSYAVFANLTPYPTNDTLIKKVIEKFGEFYICSHPSPIDTKDCIAGKEDWILKHIIPKYGKWFRGAFFPEDKSEFAVTDGVANVLIDDFTPYVDKWNQKGGIAIKLQSSHYNNETINKYLDEQFSKIPMTESFKIFFEKSIDEPRHPGILKRQVKGKLTCSKAKKLEGKGGLTAKAARRFQNYHCQ
jgi:5'(3')-deoxyribonucleotidase